MGVTVTVSHKTETVGGREYPLTVTKQHGLQKIEVGGELVEVVDVTIFESPLGRSRCFTRATPEAPPEVREANRQRIQEIAAQAMFDQGIW